MDSDWDRFISRCQQALGDLVEGRPGPFKALWSHADDIVIMGAFGGYERGWEQVSARLDWASAGIKATDRVVTVVGDDLACTVDLEHMTRHVGGQLAGAVTATRAVLADGVGDGLAAAALRDQARSHSAPAMSIEDLLGRLASAGVPKFAAEARRHLWPANPVDS